MKTILRQNLKPDSLIPTGEKIYLLDEYIYIKSFTYDDNNSISVSFLRLLKTSETTFDLLSETSTPYYKYSVSDNKPFFDINSVEVYKEDANGIIFEDVYETSTDEYGNVIGATVSKPVSRNDDFTRNYIAFSSLIIPSISKDIKNFLGYHLNP